MVKTREVLSEVRKDIERRINDYPNGKISSSEIEESSFSDKEKEVLKEIRDMINDLRLHGEEASEYSVSDILNKAREESEREDMPFRHRKFLKQKIVQPIEKSK